MSASSEARDNVRTPQIVHHPVQRARRITIHTGSRGPTCSATGMGSVHYTLHIRFVMVARGFARNPLIPI